MKTKKLLLTALITLSAIKFLAAQSWVAQSSGTTQNLNCVFFINKDTGYAGGNGIVNPTLLKTTNGGITWSTISFPSQYNLNKIYFTSKDTGYALTQNTQLFKTTDGGTTWYYLRNIGYYGSINAAYNGDIYFQNSSIGFVRSYWDAYIFRTLNGGLTWDSLPLANNCGGCPSKIDFINNSIGYTRSNTSSIYKTTNSGNSWTLLTTPTSNSITDFKFINSNLGFAVGNLSNNILKTINGGTNWSVLPVGLNIGNTKKILFTSNKDAFMLNSTGSIITKSTDTCNTWIAMGLSPSNVSFNDFFMLNDTIGYAVGNSGVIYKTFPGAIAAPTLASSNLFTSNIANNSMTLNWTSGNGTRRLVIARANSNSMSHPINGAQYTSNPNFGIGSSVSSGAHVVYDGTASSCNISGLNLNTTYFFRVYEYNGSGANTNYLTSSFATGGSTTLPVKWLEFKSETIDNLQIKLKWTTTNESNNSHFEIQRSINKNLWENLGTVKGTNRTNEISQYYYVDTTANVYQQCFYRIKQIDLDGKFDYSTILVVKVKNNLPKKSFNVHPNPNSGIFNLIFEDNSFKTISLINSLGNIIYEAQCDKSDVLININEIPNGVYFVRMQTNDYVVYSKIIKE